MWVSPWDKHGAGKRAEALEVEGGRKVWEMLGEGKRGEGLGVEERELRPQGHRCPRWGTEGPAWDLAKVSV